MKARYNKPELTVYGSVDVNYFSPSNQASTCSCDCVLHPSGGCATVGAFSCGTDTVTCAAACGSCDEAQPPC